MVRHVWCGMGARLDLAKRRVAHWVVWVLLDRFVQQLLGLTGPRQRWEAGVTQCPTARRRVDVHRRPRWDASLVVCSMAHLGVRALELILVGLHHEAHVAA